MTNSSYEPEAEPDDGLLAEGQPERKTMTRRARRRGGLVRRLARYAIILAMIPLALTILYIPPFVHPVSTLMLRDLATFQGYDRRWVSIDDISPNLVNAVIMSEDGQYCAHQGIDWNAMRSVVDSALSGNDARGASTIPMQTVKNLFLWNGRSYVRKALEAPLALYFDFFMPKRRLMEIYLNIAEWGPGIYGAEAAAQHHFGRSAANLTARQGALLAVSLPNPITRNAGQPGAGLSRLANRIQARAQQSGAYVGCVR